MRKIVSSHYGIFFLIFFSYAIYCTKKNWNPNYLRQGKKEGRTEESGGGGACPFCTEKKEMLKPSSKLAHSHFHNFWLYI